MKLSEAPPAGWYPDPSGRTRLRWWDGLDWTNDLRSVPSVRVQAEMDLVAATAAAQLEQDPAVRAAQAGARSRKETEEIIAQVRDIARREVDRAAEVFSQRAETAVSRIQPLVTEYTNKAVRWIRMAVVVALVILVAWFVLQFVIQASLLEWLGDRIDSLTND